MARGAAKQRPRAAKAEVRPRAARKPPVAEQTMFFMRLRRSTKPVFIFLAFVFALSFVFLGVGSGSAGIGDLLRGNFHLFGGGSSGTSVSKAQDRVKKHPNDAGAYRDLARAYEAKNETGPAIAALNSYVRLRPKDVGAMTELASLYLTKADAARQQAIAAQAASQNAPFSATPQLSGSLASAIGQNPLNASAQQASTALTTAIQKMQSAYGSAVAQYKKVAARTPHDPSVQLQLASTAENAGDNKTAIAAYKRFLKLAPDDPSAPDVKKRIKALRSTPRLGGSSTG
jgi:cytochrome c-type biogenesis protein CcmH/NrfG